LMGPRGIQPEAIDPQGGDRDWKDHLALGSWRRRSPGRLAGCAAVAAAAAAVFVPPGHLGGLLAAGSLLWLRAIYGGFLASGAEFLRFQWDVLLVEAGSLGAACALAALPLSLAAQRTCAALAAHAMGLLGVKLMWGSFACKLASSCPEWSSGSAMAHHHRTTCIPKPLGRAAHLWTNRAAWRSSWQGLGTMVTEGPLCLLALSGLHQLRGLCVAAWFGLMAVIAVTGNYGFFNLLSCVIFVALLDDVQLHGFVNPHLIVPAARLSTEWMAVDAILTGVFVVGWVTYAAATVAVLFSASGAQPPALASRAGRALAARGLSSSFGLFARMTTTRDEVVIRELHELPAGEGKGAEGGGGKQQWVELALPYKPGPLDRQPPSVLLHMPRLDWQFWFVSLTWARRGSPPIWFRRFLELLRERRPEVVRLISHKGQSPLQEKILNSKPLATQVTLEEYQYSSPKLDAALGPDWERGRWWRRRPLLTYEESA